MTVCKYCITVNVSVMTVAIVVNSAKVTIICTTAISIDSMSSKQKPARMQKSK